VIDLIVNAERHRGWSSVQIEHGMSQLAGAFSLAYIERGAAKKEAFPLFEGDRCSLIYKGATVLEGYIDEAPAKYAAGSHSLSVAGRSKVGDLVDCSAMVTAGQLKKRTLKQIAEAVCLPFGITVKVETDIGGAFKKLDIESGQSAFEVLELAARQRGVLLTSNSNGDLVLTRAGNQRTATVLRYGDNILSGEKSGSWAERFSEYHVRAQVSGSNDFAKKKASAPKGDATDSFVLRYRPLVVIAEEEGTGEDLTRRAEWERNTRAGKSQRVLYRVRGWENLEGLWQSNTLVAVDDPVLRVHSEMLIEHVSLSFSEQGLLSELTLVMPEALGVEPLPMPKGRSGKNSFFGGV